MLWQIGARLVRIGIALDTQVTHCFDGSVRIRHVAATIATAFVAICVALAVPVSQLQLRTDVTTCCCPDPAKCHCPDHNGASDEGTSMRACHKTYQELVSADFPSFAFPWIAGVELDVQTALVTMTYAISPPKPPPVPEPTGPS